MYIYSIYSIHFLKPCTYRICTHQHGHHYEVEFLRFCLFIILLHNKCFMKSNIFKHKANFEKSYQNSNNNSICNSSGLHLDLFCISYSIEMTASLPFIKQML